MSADNQTPQPAANDENSTLSNLKALLVGPEQTAIQRLEKESHDPEIRNLRVAESLPSSLNRAYKDSPRELTRSLEMPVSECIEGSIKRNPGFFADILYPVMGPAIRRSITQAMRELVQQINQGLEHSLTVKGMKWRIEAARSGVPFAEIVLRHTLRYRVEDAFLIQGGSGLLIQHLSQDPAHAGDADAVSAMLTAIRDFTHDTLDPDGEDSRLETVDVGDHTLWLIHGPKAYLACAIRGIPPVGLRDELATVLEEIHRRHSTLLEGFDGDPVQAAPVAPLMEPCLRTETAPNSGKQFPWPLLLILLATAGALAWWGYAQWQTRQAAAEHRALQTAAVATLSSAPGIVLTDWQLRDGRLQLQGLHDPLTPSPDSVLAASGLPTDDYSLSFRGFQSSDHAAAMKRSQQRLAPPDSVTLELDRGGILTATGYAPTAWITRAALLATTVPGVAHYDDTGLDDLDAHIQRQLVTLLQPPAPVAIHVSDGHAEITGEAPLAWINSLPAAPHVAGLNSLRFDRLLPLEMQRLTALIELIESSTIEFAVAGGVELDDLQVSKIESLAALIGEAHQHAQDMELALELQIIGRTDGTGTPQQNQFIARERAARVAQSLAAYDVPMPGFSLRAIPQAPNHAGPNDRMRRVEFRILGVEPLTYIPGSK
jgi:OOP family OmpA-OmpF porin